MILSLEDYLKVQKILLIRHDVNEDNIDVAFVPVRLKFLLVAKKLASVGEL